MTSKIKPYKPMSYSTKKSFKLLSFTNLVITGALAWGSYYGIDKYYQITENTTLAQMGKNAASQYAEEKKTQAKEAIKSKINENETTAKISSTVGGFLDKYNKYKEKENNSGASTPSSSSKEDKNIKKDTTAISAEREKIKNIQNEKSAPVNPSQSNSIALTVPVIYDHSGAPKGINQKEALEIIIQSSKKWEESCGVKFNFVKMQATDHISAENLLQLEHGVIRWEDYDKNTLGLATGYNTRQVHKPHDHYDYDHFAIGLDLNKIKNSLDMQQVLTHELGHIIGLDHSRFNKSIMFDTTDGASQQVTEGDAKACAAIVSNAKAKNKI